MVVNVLGSLGPLSLSREPTDCVNTFLEFLFSRIKEEFGYDVSGEKLRVMVS